MSDYALHGEILQQNTPIVESIDSIDEHVQYIEQTFGSGYEDVITLIEAGKQKSRAGGYAVEKVFFENKYISLPQFLATEIFRMRGRGELTKDGVDSILNRYLPKKEEQAPQHDHADATARLAVQALAPYHVGRHNYRDYRDAAANDDTFDDE